MYIHILQLNGIYTKNLYLPFKSFELSSLMHFNGVEPLSVVPETTALPLS